MNLFPIIYTSLLIFSIFIVFTIFISYILYKVKNHNSGVQNADSSFVLRRPVTPATVTSKIIYQQSNSSNNLNQRLYAESLKRSAEPLLKQYSERRRNSSKEKDRSAIPSPNRTDSRYTIISNVGQASYRGGYSYNNSQRSLNSLNYYHDNIGSYTYRSGNQSQF